MVRRLALASVAAGVGRTIDLAASDVQPGREKTSLNGLGPAYSSRPADYGGAFLQESQIDEQHGSLLPAHTAPVGRY